MECKVHPQQTITNYFVGSDGNGIVKPMCPVCVEEHSHMKKEKGEYMSYQSIKDDAIEEINTLKSRLGDNIRTMQSVSAMNAANGTFGVVDTKLAKIRQVLVNQVDFVINSIKQDIIQDGGSQCNSEQLLKQFIQDQNYLTQLENEIQRRNQQAIIDLYQNRIIKEMQYNFEKAEKMKSSMDSHEIDVRLKENQLKEFRCMLSDLIIAKSNRQKSNQRCNTYANDSTIQANYSKDSFKYYLDNQETVRHKPVLKKRKYEMDIKDSDSDCDDCESQSDCSDECQNDCADNCLCQSRAIVTHHPIIAHHQPLVQSVGHHQPLVQSVPVQMVNDVRPQQSAYISTPQRQSYQKMMNMQSQKAVNVKPILKNSNRSQMSFNQNPIMQQSYQLQKPQMIQQSYHVQQPQFIQQSKMVQQQQQPKLVHQQVKQSQVLSSSRTPAINSSLMYVGNQQHQMNMRVSRPVSRQSSLSSNGGKRVNIGQSSIVQTSNIGRQQVNVAQSRILSRSNSVSKQQQLKTSGFNGSYQQGQVLGPQYNQYGLYTNQPQHRLSSSQISSSQIKPSYQFQTVNPQNSYVGHQNLQNYNDFLNSNRKSSLKSSQYSPGKQVKFQDQMIGSVPNYSQNQILTSQLI